MAPFLPLRWGQGPYKSTFLHLATPPAVLLAIHIAALVAVHVAAFLAANLAALNTRCASC